MIFDVFKKTRNYKYAQKEKKKKVNMVAMKVRNTSDSAVVLSPGNFKVISAGAELMILTPEVFSHKVRQQSAWYLFWFLANVSWTSVEFPKGQPPPVTKLHFIPTGPPIGLFNIIVAENANAKLRKHLREQSLLGKRINPGEEVYGYLFISQPLDRNLELRILR